MSMYIVHATFVNIIFRNFAWNGDIKSLFCIVGTSWMGWGLSWMGLTHGNVIFDILEPSAFQKYSIGWVFQAFFTAVVYMCTIFAFNRFLINKYRLWANIRYDLTHMWCWSGLGIFHRKPISFFSVCFPITWRNLFLHLPPRKQWWAPGRLLIAVHTPLHLLHLINCV